MRELMKIGEFAAALNTTTKTLRHYEEIGIFSPAYRDPITGYRYYDIIQMKEAYTILSLKSSGIPIKKIDKSLKKGRLIDLFLEASERLEGEIEELTQLKESIDRRIGILKNVGVSEDNLTIEVKELSERQYLILRFPPIEEIGGPEIYKRALEFEGLIKTCKLPFIFKGSLLSLDALKKNSFSAGALIYQVEEVEGIDEKNLYRSKEGRYLCIRYQGDPKNQSEVAMKTLNRYMEENTITASGEVIGFSHMGAHTGSAEDEYCSEIQVRIQ